MKSIAVRFLLPVVLLAGVFLAADGYQDYQETRRETTELLDCQTALALAFSEAIREYVAEEIRPAMEARVGPDEFFPETMSTTYIARRIFEKVREDFPDYTIKFSSDDPMNPANRAGPDELEMIRYFNDHPEAGTWSGEIDLNGRAHAARFSASRMQESCVQCHGDPADAPASLIERYGATAGFHRPVGEVVALNTVAIPMDKVQAAVAAGARHHIAFLAAGVAALVLLIGVVFRVLVGRRLARLRTHFERIAAQPDAAAMRPAEVRGQDEISALARGFNAMVERVRGAHALLERRVADQTLELRTTNDELQREIADRKRAQDTTLARAADLQQQTIELVNNRRVALNLMDDAQSARESAEELNERLSRTATEIKGLMDAAIGDSDLTRRFENPRLLRCWEVKECNQKECPSYDRVDNLRCWEVSGTFCRGEVQGKFAKKLKDCRKCEVYQAAHADPVTDLGETFNQMMTILHDRQESLEAALRDAESARESAEAAREERREEEQKLRAITSSAQDAIIMMDHDGKVAFWNKAAERIFGWTEHEMMGRLLHTIVVPDQYRDAHHAAYPVFQKTGKGAAIGQTLPLQARHKNGTEIPIELSLSAFQLDGQWCSIGMVRDISERVQTERSRARLKAAIEVATEMIVITDTDGVIQYVNPAFEQTTGYTCAGAIGANPRVLSSGEHDKAFYKDLWDTISSGEVWQGHFVNKKKDGTLYHEEATISPVRDEHGEIVNYVAVKRDVTRQRVIERQLLQAQKMESIGQLAAGIAHEINTPTQYVGDNTRFVRDSVEDLVKLADRHVALLASIKGGSVRPELVAELESAIEKLDLEFVKEEIPKAIEQTLDGVDRVAEIVRAMKDFSHPGTDEKTPTDLNKAIRSTITVCRNRWKYVADLETDFAIGLPPVPCLVGEFNQVILNVIVNAADAIGEILGDGAADRGRIAVSTRRNGEWVEIRVSDTGGGIPREIQQKVFDPFFTTKQVGKGTGQGLSICHDVIVNKHGGTIDFEVEPGTGTTFIIRLPIAEQAAARQRGAA